MAKILVTGVGGPAGRNVTLVLMERGHTVIGTDMREVDFAGAKFHVVPAANDPHFLDELYAVSVEEKVELLIPTVSEELTVVAMGQSRWQHVPVVIAADDAVCIANDKYLTCQRLFAAQVAVPRYTLPSQMHSPSDVAKKIGWPCLSKPRVGRGGRGVTVHKEDDWQAIAELNDGFLLQEFAPGVDYSPDVYLDWNGNALATVLEKTELKEGIVGNALKVQRVDNAPDVADLAISAGRALGFHGPLDVDVRRRADGIPVVLEINARFGANIAHVPELIDAMLADYGIV